MRPPDFVRGGALRRKGFRPGDANSDSPTTSVDLARVGAWRLPFINPLDDLDREGMFRVASRIAPNMSLERCRRAIFR